jgi:hypothetical protein
LGWRRFFAFELSKIGKDGERGSVGFALRASLIELKSCFGTDTFTREVILLA